MSVEVDSIKLKCLAHSLLSTLATRSLLRTLVVRGAAPLPLPALLTVPPLLLWRPVFALLRRLVVPGNSQVRPYK